MTKRIIVPVAVLLSALAAIALWSFLVPPPNTIILKKDGFHPRTLTVPRGTTVTFTNESGKYFWPASDFHPTHALYPAFDAKEPIASGASYAFTFDAPGTYPFHDHLAAYFLGIIRVAAEDGTVPDDCASRGDIVCWQNELFSVLAKDGLDAAFDRLTTLYESDDDVASSCHTLTHNLGLASFQLYLADPDSIYTPKAVACGSGFYHGFMEGMLGASGSIEKASAICDAVGERLATDSPDARYQCFHGIGHGALETAVASTGVFGSVDEMIGTALTLCESASDGEEERYRCASGAFNALANFYIVGAYGLDAKKEDPFALCARQSETYKESCYGNMNSLAFWLGGNDFTDAVRYVLAFKDTALIPRSVEYLAALAAVPHLHDASFGGVISECHALPAMYQNSCTTGFAHGLLEHGSPGTEYVAALRFCAEPALSDSGRDECYRRTLGTLQGWYSDLKSKEICESVSPELQKYCSGIMGE